MKRFIAILLCLAMLLPILASCNRSGLGGNVYIANEGKVFEMYGGTITDGQAEVKENNVYIGTNSVFKHEGGTVG